MPPPRSVAGHCNCGAANGRFSIVWIAKVGEVASKERLIAEIFSFDDAVAPQCAAEVHIACGFAGSSPSLDGLTIRTVRDWDTC